MGSAAARQRIAPPIPINKYANVQAFTPAATAPATKPVAVPEERRLARKIDQAARILDSLEARESDLAADIKDLQRAKSLTIRRRERIEERIIAEMQAAGFDCVHGTREFTLRPAPLALQIVDESAIPEDYMRTTISTVADKVQIKAALQRGEDIPGVALTQKVTLCRK